MIKNTTRFGIEFGTVLGAAPLDVASAGCGLAASTL